MKTQIRNGVFETNSSSTHTLSLYSKEEWNAFRSGEAFMDYDCLVGKSEIEEKYKNSEGYKRFLEENGYEDSQENFTNYVCNYKDEYEEEYSYADYSDYDKYCERYEVLEEEVPDSNYIAVSIYSYE